MFKKNMIILTAFFTLILFLSSSSFAGVPVIEAGQENVMAINENGELWAWGSNRFSQLGISESIVSSSIPVQVTTDSLWVDVSSGYKHTIAIKDDGTLWGWGYNLDGQVGNGMNGKDTPQDKDDNIVTTTVQVGTDTDWSGVSGGAWFSTAIKNNGTIWAWGYNLNGQLGNNASGEKAGEDSPVQTGTDSDWVKVSAGHEQALSLKNDGTIWGRGYNGKGSLGDGTNDSKSSPVQINDDTDWRELFTGYEHTLAIKNDGTLWVWGRNDYGQVGDNTTDNRNSPVPIGSDNTWKIIRGGGMHSVAIKNDGTLWTWGRNDYGQLGDGTNTDRHKPKQIGTDNDWQIIDAGFYFTIAMKSDGEIWAWGNNNSGQLGDGTNTDRNAPVKVKNLTLYEIPDIEVKSLKVPNKVKVRKKAILKAVIKNSGTASAPESKVSFYLSSNTGKTSDSLSDDTLLGSKKVKVINAGKSYTVILKWKVPKKLYNKKYFVKVFCDSLSSVDEANENNNIAYSKKKIKIGE